MTTCHCDGPPHAYDPKWCREGVQVSNGVRTPINKRIAAARLELQAAQLRAEADREEQ